MSDPQVVRALALLMEMGRSRRGVLLKHFAEKHGYPLTSRARRHRSRRDLKHFAEKHGYPLRAVYRSRDTLIKAGAPIQVNPESPARWQLTEGWLPPSVVGAAKDELMALFVARQLAPGLRGTAVGRSLDTLWSKLASPAPQQALQLSEPALPFAVRGWSAIEYGEHRATLDQLQSAIANRQSVRIRYRTPDAAITDRVIEPGFLHWDGGLEAMYVPSWCRLRDAIRVFAVHRILEIEAMPNEPARAMPAKRMMERAFRVWYRDKLEHVQILFSSRVAGEIRERRWHSSQRLVEASDGGVALHLDITAPQELERWLLGYGPDARVIEPAMLAEQIRMSHQQAAGVGQLIEASQLPARRPRTVKPGLHSGKRARRSS